MGGHATHGRCTHYLVCCSPTGSRKQLLTTINHLCAAIKSCSFAVLDFTLQEVSADFQLLNTALHVDYYVALSCPMKFFLAP